MRSILNPFPGAPFYYREKTGSTMKDARDRITSGSVHGTIVAAGFQDAGRGRFRERCWEGEAGKNLLFSIILEKKKLSSDAALLPLTAGLAASETFREMYGTETRIKWPNDVLWQERKVSGVLCEGVEKYIIAGVGINCNQNVFSEGLLGKAVSLSEITGSHIDQEALLVVFLSRLRALIEMDDIPSRVGERLMFKGERVSVSTGIPGNDKRVSGVLMGIGAKGELILKLPAEVEEVHIHAGELINL